MRVTTLNGHEQRDGVQKIGAAPHWRRNLWLVVAVAAAAATLTIYYAFLGRHDAREVAQLEKFRAAYAQRCDSPGFADQTPAIVRETYLNSAALRDAVDRELVELQNGVSCDAIYKALRAADFPILAAPEKVPTITVGPPAAETPEGRTP